MSRPVGLARWPLAALLAGWAAPAGAQPVDFTLDDPLRGGTQGQATGGRFDADGWHVDDRRDAVWYALPRLVEGAVEFTVTGVTRDRLVLTDHEFFALYEAGYGIAEPIVYDPAFRGNHYKCLMRVYGLPEPDRTGAQKLMWGLCPSGEPGYGDCGCGSFFEEPFGGDPTWTGAPSRVRVSWAGGVTRLERDGALALQIDWADSGLAFGPSELHFTLGSPRARAVDDAGLPVGAVFSDLHIEGRLGSLATCGAAPAPDASGPGPDAGTPDPTEGLRPTDDVTVDVGLGDAVFPDVGDLAVESAGGVPGEIVYLRFEVPRAVRQATLVLTARQDASAAGDGATVHAVAGTDWDETTLTWAARPAESPQSLGATGPTTPGGEYAVDVTAAVHAGAVAFALRGADDGSHFSSKEDRGGAAPPLLVVQYAAEVEPAADAGAAPAGDALPTAGDGGLAGPPPSRPAETREADAGPNGAGGVAGEIVGGAGDPDTAPSAEAGGGSDCNCGTQATAPGGSGAWLLALWAVRPRRSRKAQSGPEKETRPAVR